MEVLNLKVNPIQSALYQTQLWPSTARPHFSQRSKIKSTLQSSRSRWCNVTFTVRNRNAHAPSNLLPRALAVLHKGDLQMREVWPLKLLRMGMHHSFEYKQCGCNFKSYCFPSFDFPFSSMNVTLGLKSLLAQEKLHAGLTNSPRFFCANIPGYTVGGCWRNSEM